MSSRRRCPCPCARSGQPRFCARPGECGWRCKSAGQQGSLLHPGRGCGEQMGTAGGQLRCGTWPPSPGSCADLLLWGGCLHLVQLLADAPPPPSAGSSRLVPAARPTCPGRLQRARSRAGGGRGSREAGGRGCEGQVDYLEAWIRPSETSDGYIAPFAPARPVTTHESQDIAHLLCSPTGVRVTLKSALLTAPAARSPHRQSAHRTHNAF